MVNSNACLKNIRCYQQREQEQHLPPLEGSLRPFCYALQSTVGPGGTSRGARLFCTCKPDRLCSSQAPRPCEPHMAATPRLCPVPYSRQLHRLRPNRQSTASGQTQSTAYYSSAISWPSTSQRRAIDTARGAGAQSCRSLTVVGLVDLSSKSSSRYQTATFVLSNKRPAAQPNR